MFRGVTALTLDSKGRLAIPARHREALLARGNGQLVVTVDHDPCLLLYPLPDWLAIEEKLERLPSFEPNARRMQRLLIGHATECELDASGRILLPAPLREYARLDKSVMFVGQGKKFEIWDEREWSARRAEWQAQGLEGALPPELGSLSL
jgi:MraZ protein